MIGTGYLEKLLEVISGLPRLALEVSLSSGDELLFRVADLLVVATLITAGNHHDSLESLFQPPLVAFGSLLCALAGCLEWCPLTTTEGCFPTVLDENSPGRLLMRGGPGGDVKKLLHCL
jgi:hypothetical protein